MVPCQWVIGNRHINTSWKVWS